MNGIQRTDSPQANCLILYWSTDWYPTKGTGFPTSLPCGKIRHSKVLLVPKRSATENNESNSIQPANVAYVEDAWRMMSYINGVATVDINQSCTVNIKHWLKHHSADNSHLGDMMGGNTSFHDCLQESMCYSLHATINLCHIIQQSNHW